MNCIEFRRLISSEPDCQDPGVSAHLSECKTCEGFAAGMHEFDARLRAAMLVDVPADLMAGVERDTLRPRRRTMRWFAVAASVFLVVGLAAGVWLGARSGNLHDAVIAHIYHEPELLVATAEVADAYQMQAVLKRGNVSLKADIGEVTHSSLCLFRGHLVAHVVVRGEQGPVTVLLLPDETVQGPERINEEGFRGTIFPVGTGSIAVVGTADEPTEKIEKQVSQAVEWTI